MFKYQRAAFFWTFPFKREIELILYLAYLQYDFVHRAFACLSIGPAVKALLGKCVCFSSRCVNMQSISPLS